MFIQKLWHFAEKTLGMYRWHPKIALRYLPIVEALKKEGREDDVLEVGSAGLGIAPYLGRIVVGVDIDFSPPVYPALIPVKASVLALPFADDAFAAVVSVDMLEHIAPQDRGRAIYEMARVARNFFVIGVPCGSLAQLQDEELEKFYRKIHGHDFHFLREQVDYKVPTKEEMKTFITLALQQLGKQATIMTQGNINLRLRKILMYGWIRGGILNDIFFRKILLVFIPVLRRLNQEPTYRQLFFVKISHV